eukprot:1159145-Pelagomonas_calceolata.AAC.36
MADTTPRQPFDADITPRQPNTCATQTQLTKDGSSRATRLTSRPDSPRGASNCCCCCCCCSCLEPPSLLSPRRRKARAGSSAGTWEGLAAGAAVRFREWSEGGVSQIGRRV